MTPDQWKRLQALFDKAIGLEAEARSDFIASECGDDEVVRSALESMLLHDSTAAEDLTGIVGEAALGFVADDPDPWEGREIGCYRITEKIAEGGMGAVYLGERADDQYQQQVAIKLLRSGLISPSMKNRFLAERQILANLNHPNIATLIDGGTTHDNVPYLVMEFVEGVSIDKYCDEHHLDNEARLKLFQTVCGAVQFAHQNLIVHRDIKPGNILVDSGGVPKLLDFGIAKLLDTEQNESYTPELTRADMRILTPEYASPEQVRGEAITTATDIYALGLLLFRLLTGSSPYTFDGYSASEIEQSICNTEALRPSVAIGNSEADQTGEFRGMSMSRLQRQLRGDLDNIVLAALRKEPERRYSTVRTFSDDIQRYLDKQPVLARPTSLTYRTKKFVDRNALAMALATTILVLSVGLVTFYTLRLAHERDVAQRERDAAEAVTEFLVELFEVSEPSEARGNSITAREVLDRGSERIAHELREQPVIRARLLEAIGRVYFGLGLYDQARKNFAEVAELRNSIGANSTEIATTRRREATALMELGDALGSADMLREVLRKQEQEQPPNEPEIVQTLTQLGQSLFRVGEIDASIKTCEDALERAEPFTAENIEYRGEALLCLGISHNSRRELDTAQGYLSRAIDELSAEFGMDYPPLLNLHHELAHLFFASGDYAEAIDALRLVERQQIKMLGPDHADVARTLVSIASSEWGRNNNSEARAIINEAIAIMEKSLAPNHRDFGKAYYTLAALARTEFDFEESDRMFLKTLSIQRKISEPDDPDLGNTLAEYALVLEVLGQYDEAAAALRESIGMQERSLGRNHLWVALSLSQLGDILATQGQPGEGVELIEDALTRATDSAGADHHHTMTIRRYLATAVAATGDLQRAIDLQNYCLGYYRKAYGAESELVGALLGERGMVLADMGDYAAAKADLVTSLDILSEEHGVDSPGLARVYYELARAYKGLDRPEEAKANAEIAYTLYLQILPKRHPRAVAALELMAK